jgi:hypothetical protein
MVYLGYDFSVPIIEGIDALSILVKESLSKQRLEVAMAFLKDVGALIASEFNLFRIKSNLSETAVGISIMENYTGREGFSETEESQAWHTDYGSDGLYDVFYTDD